MQQNMASPPKPWPQLTDPPLDVRLKYWNPDDARARFMAVFLDNRH
jgi:hypothetical protein